jgi:hypothetical protein
MSEEAIHTDASLEARLRLRQIRSLTRPSK